MTNKFLGPEGRMISSSKSGYRNRFPYNLVVFNANVVAITKCKLTSLKLKTKISKIWFGDIDITVSRNQLKDLAVEEGRDILVLYEMDARFENENSPIIDNFVYKVTPDGKEYLGESLKQFYVIDELTLWKK
jgi:hypothetical protein